MHSAASVPSVYGYFGRGLVVVLVFFFLNYFIYSLPARKGFGEGRGGVWAAGGDRPVRGKGGRGTGLQNTSAGWHLGVVFTYRSIYRYVPIGMCL